MDFYQIELDPGTYHTQLTYENLIRPGEFTYTLRAETSAGGSSESKGKIVHTLEKDETLPVAHTIVKGVDISNWRAPCPATTWQSRAAGFRSISVARTTVPAIQNSGPLGAGWTDSYNFRLVRDNSGVLTIIGGEGSGNSFGSSGHTDAATAQLFGLADPAHALFFDPQVGYHSFLVKPDPTKDAYDFYTTGHIHSHFELEPDVEPLDIALPALHRGAERQSDRSLLQQE